MKKKIAFSTFIGLAVSLTLVINGMREAGHLSLYINIPSIFMIFGGTLGATIISFPPKHLKKFFIVFRKAFSKEKYDFIKDIQALVTISEFSRKKGLLALETLASDYENEAFLQKGMLLITDGVSKDVLVSTLKSDIFYMKKRHAEGQAMMDYVASTVTSLGLMGTYIGLIPMLNNLENPETLGPLMAIELVSSFYGAFTSYVIMTPIARRLGTMNADEVLRNTLLIEGLVAIREQLNPRIIEERLLSSLTKKQQKMMANRSGRGDKAENGKFNPKKSGKMEVA